MPFFIKKYLICIFLIAATLTEVVAQEKKIPFTWLDQTENRMAGSITANLVPQGSEGLYQLDFTVTWFNAEGRPITATNQMPVLGLSKWDLILPEQHIRCTSFDQKKAFPPFQTNGRLNLQVLNDFEGDVNISISFQYALSQSLYESGKSDVIDIQGSKSLTLVYTVTSGKKPAKIEIGNVKKQPDKTAVNPATLRSTSDHYRNLSLKVANYEKRTSKADLGKPGYLQELELLLTEIDNERVVLNPDSLPADTIRSYRERYNALNSKILDLRTAYLRFQISQSNLISGSDPASSLRRNDSLRNLVRNRFEPVLQAEVDTLDKISNNQKAIANEISNLIAGKKSRKTQEPVLDTLIRRHDRIKGEFEDIVREHENTWSNYRIELVLVREVENLHNTFQKNQNDLKSAIDLVDQGVSALVQETAAAPWYMSNRFLWTGMFLVIVLVFLSAIWSSSRNRKILRDRLHILEGGIARNNGEKPAASGDLSDAIPNEYYSIDYQESMPESVVGKVHYHISAIKSVQNLVQGAVLDRNGSDFGGYLFGNQYKLPGKGSSRSELFIERACDSKFLRSSIKNDITERAELIDELDELVRQNKKYRLLGWFTASADKSLEIPEGLMKIHRSFFKEKWQVGILLNPGSDVLQGAGFFRRKSGYLDPMPDPSAFVKWDELYRFALNPDSLPKNGKSDHSRKDNELVTISMNNTWGDSIVTEVSFDVNVINDITVAAAGQAIPKDTFQVVGYLYGSATVLPSDDGSANEYKVFVDRFIELSNEITPRDLPGLSVLGWWGQANIDVMNYLQNAVDHHETIFREPYQFSCLANPGTGELRIITRKHSLEMNNSTIETEEYSLNSLLSR